MIDTPSFFADADASFQEACAVLFGVPFDATSTFRKGAKDGPVAIRQASWNFETFDIYSGTDLAEIPFHDYGDIQGISSSQDMISSVQTLMRQLLKQSKFPICLGGEHSVTMGCITAVPKDTVVVSIDAHLDYRDKYEEDPFNHACVSKRIQEHVGAENLFILGVRSAEKKEYKQAQQDGVTVVTSHYINDVGLFHILRPLQQKITGKRVYLTIDIDGVDPAFAPGTSTPEPNGLTPDNIQDLITLLAPNLIGCDLVEVCPAYDHGQTALLAAKLLRFLLSKVSIYP